MTSDLKKAIHQLQADGDDLVFICNRAGGALAWLRIAAAGHDRVEAKIMITSPDLFNCEVFNLKDIASLNSELARHAEAYPKKSVD